jgi:hypothetical protein
VAHESDRQGKFDPAVAAVAEQALPRSVVDLDKASREVRNPLDSEFTACSEGKGHEAFRLIAKPSLETARDFGTAGPRFGADQDKQGEMLFTKDGGEDGVGLRFAGELHGVLFESLLVGWLFEDGDAEQEFSEEFRAVQAGEVEEHVGSAGGFRKPGIGSEGVDVTTP